MILSELMQPAMDSLVKQMEGEFRAALDELVPDWTLLDVKTRCAIVRVQGSPVETLHIDGKPVLEMHPIEYGEPVLRGGAYTMTITRRLRRLPTAAPPLPTTASQESK